MLVFSGSNRSDDCAGPRSLLLTVRPPVDKLLSSAMGLAWSEDTGSNVSLGPVGGAAMARRTQQSQPGVHAWTFYLVKM